MKALVMSFAAVLILALAGCAALNHHRDATHTGSVVDYLYPNAKEAPQLQPTTTRLRLPVRVGIAFVPSSGSGIALPEAEKQKLLERVKASFSQHPYIGGIEVIPSQYLRSKGGFDNLDQAARMFNVEVIALLSTDQVQFNDANMLSFLYWTIVGAYIVQGDQYDIQTMIDASVFDVASRKLLFRAPGTSRVKGSATANGFSEEARAGRLDGYNKAIDALIPQLQAELGRFKERIKADAGYRVENRPGYSGGGDFGWLGLPLALALAGAAYATRRKH